MPKFLALILSLTTAAQAEIVLWTTTGALTSGTGVFERADLPPGDPVTIRVTYDDQATQQIRGEALGQIQSDYRTDINLRITITSGENTWEGFVESGDSTGPTTFFTVIAPFQTSERADFTIDSIDNGSFPSFPFRLGQSAASIFLDFNGANNAFLGSGISATDIHPEELSSATGTISNGVGNRLSFTIDPTSLEVILEADEIVPPIAPVLSLATTPTTALLSWQSDFRFRYQVESTADLSAPVWDIVETRFGTDAIITRIYPRPSRTLFYRVVALERPPLE